MKNKNIVLIGPSIYLKGGIATVIRDIYNSHLKDLFNIELVSTYDKSAIKPFFTGLIKYLSLLLLGKVDIAHVNLASRGSFFRKIFFIIMTPRNKKLIIHLHGGGFIDFYKRQSNIIQKLIRYSFNKADLIITVSDIFKNILIEVMDLDEKKIIRIYNGISLKDNVKINEASKAIKVLFMGKLNRDKGIYDFIEVIKKIKATNKEVKFLIAGNGDIEAIKELVEKEGLTEQTKILGWIEGSEKEEILSKCDILLAPSHFEAFGISIVEGMNYGLAIVAYSVGGIPEIVEDSINGYLNEVGDIEGMAHNLQILIKNSKLLKEIKTRNIEKSKEFSKEKFIDNIRKLYSKLS